MNTNQYTPTISDALVKARWMPRGISICHLVWSVSGEPSS